TVGQADPNHEFVFRQFFQLHSLQVGAVDGLVGELMDHLKAAGAWEDSLVVVTSDHGVDLTPPGLSRGRTDDTVDEILRVPLFVKAPGQTAGEVRDERASTLDVLPSVVDLLDIETDW